MRLESPLALILLLFLPLFLEGSYRQLLRRIPLLGLNAPLPALRFASQVALQEIHPSLRQKLQAPVLSCCRMLSFLLLVIALARPQTGTELIETEASARDIFLVLDVSGSMEALDFTLDGKQVDRLTALKSVVADFILRREHDRIGLAVFGTEVYTQCPLTLDHALVRDFVAALEVGMAGDATAVGDGLAIAAKRLRDIPGNSKVIVLVTDGLKTAGALEPVDAAEIAKKLGIKIYTIGIGGKAPAPFRTSNIFGFETLEYREVPIDEDSLREIAKITDGRYFHASRTEELMEIYDEIDRLEERREKTFDYVEYEEHFLWFAAAGFMLLLCGEALRRTVLAVLP